MNKLNGVVSLAAGMIAAFCLAACATSSARIEKARTSGYQADYHAVWNAVVAATQAEGFDRIKVADEAHGRLVTDWQRVDNGLDLQTTARAARSSQEVVSVNGLIYFRVVVQIQGTRPPFKVNVDGEAARWRPEFPMLYPYKHGIEGEPHWVNGRINAMYVEVLDQLEQYAVEGGAALAGAAPVLPPDNYPPDEYSGPERNSLPIGSAGTLGPGGERGPSPGR